MDVLLLGTSTYVNSHLSIIVHQIRPVIRRMVVIKKGDLFQ
ncbi:hypothetical protein GCWU000342_01792 [Shuttleworthella satelles DSM 14600]|uniref:Uncharacterized protein n=1 Tax=Shuttleworthella satelles DSM 14600 TaxID=626523 RepID=C4GCU9_9FIRM|nr:hypothetical protein GCWU000342_01792 [Shuttleworthia satelles DSM 14600]